MKTIRILILEDDLLTLATLLHKFHLLEEELIKSNPSSDIAVTILSEYTQVEEYLNKTNHIKFDVILLDRDCKACGSFHCLDLDKYGKDRIISISSTPKWNKEAVEKGIKRVAYKDYSQIDKSADRIIKELKVVLGF
ncbi:MAG: hypothetical protein RBS77_02905 [Candidatus Moranbacteria bacterium]|jgi:hypothetical protein|nr:hypothetical protein [Candidatus Moranbacteria bacterium]